MRIATDLDKRVGPGIRVTLRVALEHVNVRARSEEAATRARAAGGLWTPRSDERIVDDWLRQAERDGLITNTAEPGAVVLYRDVRRVAVGDENHREFTIVRMGIVVRNKPVPMAIEGAVMSPMFQEGSSLQMLRPIDEKEVLCFIKPEAASI